jgi:hypothetical protein
MENKARIMRSVWSELADWAIDNPLVMLVESE